MHEVYVVHSEIYSPSVSHFSSASPTPYPSLYISLPLPPNIYLSPSLAPCPVISYPRCEGDGVISIMSSDGKCERAARGSWGKPGVATG